MLTPLAKDDGKLRQSCLQISLKDLKSAQCQMTIDRLLDYVYGTSNKGKSRDRSKPMTVGLSANQVGIMQQISIVDMAIAQKNINDIHVLINPTLVWHGKAIDVEYEGCVNFPGIWGEVERYRTVKIKALDRSGNELTIKAKGWAARLLQHEIDHLKGKLFIDYLKDPTKAHVVKDEEYAAYKKNQDEWKQFIDVSSLIVRQS